MDAHDARVATSSLDRRGLLVGAGSAAIGAFVASPSAAAAEMGSPSSDVLVGQIAAHRASNSIEIVELSSGQGLVVRTTATTQIVTPDGRPRALGTVPVGESVVVVAPGAGTMSAGAVVTAERVVHCVIGDASEVQH